MAKRGAIGGGQGGRALGRMADGGGGGLGGREEVARAWQIFFAVSSSAFDRGSASRGKEIVSHASAVLATPHQPLFFPHLLSDCR
jgi:hypothetical protein